MGPAFSCSPACKICIFAIFSGQPRISISPRRYESQTGDTVKFHCDLSEGDPLTTQITWYHNRIPLQNSNRIRILPNNTLVVENLQSGDRGEYRCVASNTKGRSYAAAVIVIPGMSKIDFSWVMGIWLEIFFARNSDAPLSFEVVGTMHICCM